MFGSAESETPVTAKYAGDPVGNVIYIHEDTIVVQRVRFLSGKLALMRQITLYKNPDS